MIKITLSLILFILNLSFFNTTPSKENKRVQTGDLEASVKKGQVVYTTYCIACHQESGLGLEGAFPPLAKSDYLMADPKRAIQVVMYGKSGEITVNGKKYDSQMPDFGLNDEQVMDVVNYIQNSWGNKAKMVTLNDVKAVRAEKK